MVWHTVFFFALALLSAIFGFGGFLTWGALMAQILFVIFLVLGLFTIFIRKKR
ncbi:membrane protein [Advenella kashmirensis W13003]|uniref:Membrane protein n=1 Tax=Advenella kashmirensis W13003 TaxID=1424334 RepID=V8QW13_9BURK|nr:membrane protein [Advenella kashmirensis W13003]